jgi:acetyltransferase-like isoleucine patch superfamily enzyme
MPHPPPPPTGPLARLLARLKLRRCTSVGALPWVKGRVWIHGPGTIRLGSRVHIDARTAPVELHVGPGAELVIGDDVRLEGGVSIEAERSVTIGDRCLLEAYAKLIDNHFHPVDGDRARRPESTPIVLEADVVVRRRAIVLPGARVRSGQVVRPATVVRGLPPAARRHDAAARGGAA